MINSDIRRLNFWYLMGRMKNRKEAADLIGTSSSYLSQVLGDKPTRKIGQKIARKTEEVLGLEKGWMDIFHNEIDYHNIAAMRNIVDINNEEPLKITTFTYSNQNNNGISTPSQIAKHYGINDHNLIMAFYQILNLKNSSNKVDDIRRIITLLEEAEAEEKNKKKP